MDTDELVGLLAQGHERALVDRLASLTEAERKRLAPTVRTVLRESYIDKDNRSVLLAALGTLGGERQIANGLSFWWRSEDPTDLALQILRDRDPRWLPQLATALLAESSNWPLVRALVRAGMAERPEQPEYLLQMVGGVRTTIHWQATETIRECLEHDPGLLDVEIWDLLALEGAGRRLAYVDGWIDKPWTPPGRDPADLPPARPERTWRRALADLAADGRIDRGRLLDLVLAAPLRDWAAADLAWYARQHDELAPTAEEVLARQATYCRLLTVEHGPSVKYAQKALHGLVKDPRLEVSALLAASRATLTRPDKASVAAQLRLLAALARAHPDAGVADVVADALDHPRADVREQAQQLLARIAPDAVVEAPPPAASASFVAPGPRPRRQPDGVVPVADADELADLFLLLVEEADDPIEVERLLDGVLRLAGERPASVDVLLRRARVEDYFTSELRSFLGALAETWLEPRSRRARAAEQQCLAVAAWGGAGAPAYSVFDVASRRLQAVARRVRGGGGPGVALPTYADGSIDPADLTERLSRLGPRDRPTPEDVETAVLRVAPERLDEIGSGRGQVGRLVRDAVRRISAHRPDWERVTTQVPGRFFSQPPETALSFRDASAPPPGGGPVDSLLRRSQPLAHAGTELHVGEYESRFEQTLAFCAVQLPHHPDQLASLVHLVQLRDLSKNRGVTASLLDALARSDRRIGPPAASSLILGLAAKDARVRTSAQDALLDLAAAGFLDGCELGRQASAHLAEDLVVGTRLAAGLAEVARADDAAVLAVMDALATLLPSLPGRRDAAAFLEPAAELAERTGRRVELPEELRVQAAGRSSSIAAKAARRLVAVSDGLQGSPTTAR